MNVIVDYLVKDQTCSVVPEGGETTDLEELIDFRLEANINTYAAFASEQFAGEEAVWKNGKSVYAMNYAGRVLDKRFSGNFLKEALRAADKKMPYRGPEFYESGEYVYKTSVSGDFNWFQGYELYKRTADSIKHIQ